MNLRSDYHDTSGVIRLTLTDLILARNHIKVQPGTIGTLHHPFGAEDIVRIDKLLKYFLKFCTLEFVRCLLAPAGKYIICMMMVMVLMLMAATGTVFIMLMVMLMLLMIMAATGTVLIMLMVMMMFMVFVVMVMLMVFVVMVMMMVLMLMFCLFLCMMCLGKSLHLQIILSFHYLKDLFSG